LGDGDGVTVKNFKAQLDFAGEFSRLLIRINSPGGDPFEASAIYNLIRAQKKPVKVCIDGIAASAASIIAMAGDEIEMGPNAMQMIHNASGVCMGFADDMRSTADALDTISSAIAQTYVARTKKPLAEITAMMDGETWMTAQECVDQGFATAITQESSEVEENALALARRFKMLRKLKHVPKALRPRNAEVECGCDCPECEAGDCDECTNVDCVDQGCKDAGCPAQDGGASAGADLAAWRAKLGVKEPATITAARERLGAIDRAAGGSTVETARARLEAIEETLSKPLEGR
jgi:ATP-dependent Clp protease protease subunit